MEAGRAGVGADKTTRSQEGGLPRGLAGRLALAPHGCADLDAQKPRPGSLMATMGLVLKKSQAWDVTAHHGLPSEESTISSPCEVTFCGTPFWSPRVPLPPAFHELPSSPARAWIVIPGSQASAQEPQRGFPPGEPVGDPPEVTRTTLWLPRFSESLPVSVNCPSSTCGLALVGPLPRAGSNGGSPVSQAGVSGASPEPGHLRHRGRSLEALGSCTD